MTSLNLPPFDVRLKGTKQAPLIFDFLRRRYVRLTPEEWVRQHFVHFMVEHRHYPASLLANEVSLHVGDKVLRADTILYNKQLQPVMIVEYKAPHIPITQTVFDQIVTYNMLLHVDYLVVSNGLQHYVCKMDYDGKKYLFKKNYQTTQIFLQNKGNDIQSITTLIYRAGRYSFALMTHRKGIKKTHFKIVISH